MKIEITKSQKDYELIDSGNGKKLERYGVYTLARPDPQALWLPKLPEGTWNKADAIFIRKGKTTDWKKKKDLPESWRINFGGLQMEIQTTTFKHTGLFPEQLFNWIWMEEEITQYKARNTKHKIKVLNLFGYTGGATLICAKAGAEVVHLDGSKLSIAWARRNQEQSGLSDKPIRWILDDALVFLKREVKRGNYYDGIIMDPPAFGHGPKGEVWKIEENFTELMELSRKVLSEDPIFFLINGYASGFSPIAYENNLKDIMSKYKGTIEIGELAIEENKTRRLLPSGIFARWSKT